jgi:hypothetical protein
MDYVIKLVVVRQPAGRFGLRVSRRFADRFLSPPVSGTRVGGPDSEKSETGRFKCLNA